MFEIPVMPAREERTGDEDVSTFTPSGVCSKLIRFTVRDGRVYDVAFTGGCDGNLQGISRLVQGMSVEDVVGKLKGIRCGRKTTSCPDQLSRALEGRR
ncbi:TIGR03905 family TSCPD domain-containing protein [Desulfocurvus sp. DL9XJH121]